MTDKTVMNMILVNGLVLKWTQCLSTKIQVAQRTYVWMCRTEARLLGEQQQPFFNLDHRPKISSSLQVSDFYTLRDSAIGHQERFRTREGSDKRAETSLKIQEC